MSATPQHPAAPDAHGAHSLHRRVGRPKPEPLFGCPNCGRFGFSARGLRVHYCEALPRGDDGRRQRLPKDRVDAILDVVLRPPNTELRHGATKPNV
jgi:hypothetical protein